MSVLNFDKTEIGNLEYSLGREMLSTNRTGGYMSTTIVGCNTRKYHGLMVCPIDRDDQRSYVLLSSLDETIIQHDQPFNLAIHRFPGTFEPRGHKYITDFRYTPCPTIVYRVGGVVLQKELLWIHSRSQLLVRYTLLEAKSETKLRLRPFLAFRDKHALSKANMWADGHAFDVSGGVKCRLYNDFPWLYMQMDSREAEFAAAQEWYYNFEYPQEQARGYDFQEDLLTTGYFEVAIRADKPIIFSASLDEESAPEKLNELFEAELARRSEKNDLLSCLRHSARQFIVRTGDKTEVVAGYPWFGRWGRDTFIALPGITLAQGDVQSCIDVLNTLTREMQGGLFPNMGEAYNSVDAPLWFFWTLQELERHISRREVWERWGEAMKSVIAAYRAGVGDVIGVSENGLVWASHPQWAMTWMDAVVDGRPVTGRDGYQVEINALWYNALRYTADCATEYGEKKLGKELTALAEQIKASFENAFWYETEGYLADYVSLEGVQNTFIRPNQIIACSLPYKVIDEPMRVAIIDKVRRHLLTERGLRTLSPRNGLYEGRYEGTQEERDRAYHQGTVWVWLLEHYVRANFDIAGKAFTDTARKILSAFEEDLCSYGIGSICEIYDGDPPHHQRGAISQAWSVGALLNINRLIEENR